MHTDLVIEAYICMVWTTRLLVVIRKRCARIHTYFEVLYTKTSGYGRETNGSAYMHVNIYGKGVGVRIEGDPFLHLVRKP